MHNNKSASRPATASLAIFSSAESFFERWAAALVAASVLVLLALHSASVWADPERLLRDPASTGIAKHAVGGAPATADALFDTVNDAWQMARLQNKVVMLVMGSESCDRCSLLDRYLDHETLQARVDKNFVRVDISTSAFASATNMAITDDLLPAIILVEPSGEFVGQLPAEQMMTFRPEPYELMYDWMENLLFYSDQVFAAYSADALP